MVNDNFYSNIVALNQLAVDAGQYEVAFHLLAAALHAADDAHDEAGIYGVIERAIAQGSAVDRQANHPMAAVYARKRGTVPLYESLATTARAKIAQMAARRVIEEHSSIVGEKPK